MDSARIVVVDDEPLTCASYARALEADGHQVRTASDVFACRAALRAAPADVIVLDLGLPGIDGLTFAAELQQQGDLGIVVVTSREDVSTRVRALDEGADDYLVKPVHLEELSARVRSLVRRRARARGRRYQLGCWTVDLERRQILGPTGESVGVTRGEFDVLVTMIEAQGKIVSRETLSDALSRPRGERDVRSVDHLVSRLRRKLSLSADDPPLIVTALGFGYRLGPLIQRL